MLDLRRYAGGVGPVQNARTAELARADFEDARGFVWHALADGSYTFRPFGASADVTLTLEAGDYPAVAGTPVACEAVRRGAGLSILAANL